MTSSKDAMSASSPTNLTNLSHARFPLGQLAVTPGVIDLLGNHQFSLFYLLARHGSGDWGDVCAEDAKTNEQALIHGERLLSSYTLVPGDSNTRVWIISERDRSVTTALLPAEY